MNGIALSCYIALHSFACASHEAFVEDDLGMPRYDCRQKII